MKITRFGQSCLLIEIKNKKILIDPGNLLYEENLHDSFWKDIDILLITHKHGDHFNSEAIDKIIQDSDPLYMTTQEVQDTYPVFQARITKEGDVHEFEEFKIEVTHAQHGYLPRLKNGGEVFENVGYIIDDGKTKLYHTSDTIGFNNDYKCNVLALPLSGHGLVFDAYDGAQFAKETHCKLVLPLHLDNPNFPTDLQKIKQCFDEENVKYKFLELKESIEV